MFPRYLFFLILFFLVIAGHNGFAQSSQNQNVSLPYQSIDITFVNQNGNVQLKGTLTIPEGSGSLPGVVLIAGAYPYGSRIEKMFGQRPFYVIADHLSRNGIAVLRYDDRRLGLPYWSALDLTTEEYAEDARAALNYLLTYPGIDPQRTGLAGHSEGGLIAAIVAAKNPEVRFVISLAGLAIRGKERILLPKELLNSTEGVSEATIMEVELYRDVLDIIENEPDNSKATAALQEYFGELHPRSSSHAIDSFVFPFTHFLTEWYRFFLFTNPRIFWNKVTAPVLALIGGLDFITAKLDLQAIESALNEAENANVKFIEFPDLNHLFQQAETGSIEEFSNPEREFSPEVLDIMTEWIHGLFDTVPVDDWALY